MPDKSIEEQEIDCSLELFDVVRKYPPQISIRALAKLLMSMMEVIALKEREEQFKRIRSN